MNRAVRSSSTHHDDNVRSVTEASVVPHRQAPDQAAFALPCGGRDVSNLDSVADARR
jgi:hypothetical protein